MRPSLSADAGTPPLRLLMRLAWLVALIAAVAARGERPALTLPLLALATAGWLGWTTAHRHGKSARAAASIIAIGVSGAVIATSSAVAVAFLAAAAVAAATGFERRLAVPLALTGPIALLVASAVHGWSQNLVLGGAAAAFGGLVGGTARRQADQHAQQAARTALARELHDVLAHTLSALAVQLEAASGVLEQGDTEKVAELLARSRRLVANGIDEAASAVRALREEPVAIAEQLAALVADEEVPLRIEGTPRVLPFEAGLALYRATQEALTNARKHAPGAATSVALAFRGDTTVVTVVNGRRDTTTSVSGSGLGLQGMRERLELAGGTLDAAASGEGWTVEATVPA